MSLLSGIEREVKKLLGNDTRVEVDASWPVETPEYYEDTSVPVIYSPPDGVFQDAWAPTADQVVPGYRGIEEHGVAYNASNNYVIPIAQEDVVLDPEDSSVDVTNQVQLDPVRVEVVKMPTPRGRENTMSTAQILVTKGTTLMVAPKSYRRNRLIISVIGTDVVWISTDKQSASNQGFPITAALGKFDIDTTSEIYAFAPTTNAQDPTVYTLAQEERDVSERPV